MRLARWLLYVALVPCLLAASHPAWAASAVADQVRLFVDGQVLLPGGMEVEVVVGDPDPRLVLAPCVRLEPFVPPGARLWGRTSLGVRCVEGATWTVYLPTIVKVYGLAPVAARPLARGQALAGDDVRWERLELTAMPLGSLASPEAVDGRTTTRAIAAGEPLRREWLRAPNVLQAGDAVRLQAAGPGFAVTTDGKALTAATEGQMAQVAVAGKVLTGIARPGKVVEVR